MKKILASCILLYLCEIYSFAKVNTENLNFTETWQDVYFSCYGFPLEIARTYNVQSTIVSGFGKGWTYNYNVRLQDRDGYIRVFEADGFLSSYIPEKFSDAYKEKNINEIIKQIIAEDEKAHKLRSKEEYKALNETLLKDYNQYESMRNKYLVKSGKTSEGKYLSSSRGLSELYKTKNGYVRTNVLGIKESFDKEGRLIQMKDGYDNVLSLAYFTDKTTVTDACKRTLTINVDEDRKIQSLVDHTGRTLVYKYFKNGQLGKVIDFDKSETTYHYDKDNRLDGITFPKKVDAKTSESTKIIYGEYNRVKEIQEPGTKITTYKRTEDSKNKNHYTIIIRDNSGTSTQYDYFTDEHKTIKKDKKEGTKITLMHPATGRPSKYTFEPSKAFLDLHPQEKGGTTYYEYDGQGNRIRTTNAAGSITEFNYDKKNRLADVIMTGEGQKISYTFNSQGDVVLAQLIDIKSPQKNVLKKLEIIFNERGKKKFLNDKNGNQIRMNYDDYGNMSELEKVGVGKFVYSYDSLGNSLSQKFEIDKNHKDPLTMEELKQIISTSLAEVMTLLQY